MSSPMSKVLIVNNRYPGPKRKHQATFIRSIETAIREAGLDPDLLVNDRNHPSGIRKWLDSLFFLFKIRSSFKWKEADFFYLNHFTQYHPFIPKKYRKDEGRTVIHWHGSDLYPQTAFSRWLSRRVWKRMPRRVTHIVPSKDFGERLESELGISSYRVSPSGGVDTAHFRPSSQNREGPLVLGFAGRLSKEKGAPLLLKVLDEIDRIRNAAGRQVVINYIAYGEEAEDFLPALRSSGVGREFEPIPKEEMSRFYQDLDILFFPTRRESLGLTALEAMSCGVPVVGTYDLALKDYLIPGRTGEGFPMDDHEKAIEALIRCISRLGNYEPRDFVIEHYSREKVIEFYREFFQELEQNLAKKKKVQNS